MRSRGRSWRSDEVGVLVGTVQTGGGYVAVKVCRPRSEPLAYVVIERQRIPGMPCESRLAGHFADVDAAIKAAQETVLAKGGSLHQSAEALGGSPVTKTLARSMFTEIGLRRFVHVPTPEG